MEMRVKFIFIEVHQLSVQPRLHPSLSLLRLLFLGLAGRTPKCSWGGCIDHNVHFLSDYNKLIMMLLIQLVFFRKLIAAPELSVI